MPAVNGLPMYGDFSGVVDYHSAVQAIKIAEERFMMLPAQIRKRFRNDPQELLAFLADDTNRQEAVEMGLIEQREAPSSPEGGQTGESPTPSTPASVDAGKEPQA